MFPINRLIVFGFLLITSLCATEVSVPIASSRVFTPRQPFGDLKPQDIVKGFGEFHQRFLADLENIEKFKIVENFLLDILECSPHDFKTLIPQISTTYKFTSSGIKIPLLVADFRTVSDLVASKLHLQNEIVLEVISDLYTEAKKQQQIQQQFIYLDCFAIKVGANFLDYFSALKKMYISPRQSPRIPTIPLLDPECYPDYDLPEHFYNCNEDSLNGLKRNIARQLCIEIKELDRELESIQTWFSTELSHIRLDFSLYRFFKTELRDVVFYYSMTGDHIYMQDFFEKDYPKFIRWYKNRF